MIAAAPEDERVERLAGALKRTRRASTVRLSAPASRSARSSSGTPSIAASSCSASARVSASSGRGARGGRRPRRRRGTSPPATTTRPSPCASRRTGRCRRRGTDRRAARRGAARRRRRRARAAARRRPAQSWPRAATAPAAAASPPSSTTQNSSPPTRYTDAPATPWAAAASASAARRIAASPASWPWRVVDPLEPVEVAERDRQRAAALDRRLEALVERAPVAEPGQRVRVRERVDAREQLGAPDRSADLAGDRLQERHVPAGERHGADVGERLELAPRAPVEDHRHADVGALVERVEQLAVVVAQPRVAARDHVALAVAQQPRGERVVGQRVGLLGREALLVRPELADVDQRAHAVVLALPAADRDRGRADHAAGLLGDDLEHVLEPVRRRDRAGDGDQRAQLGLRLRRVVRRVDRRRADRRARRAPPAAPRPSAGRTGVPACALQLLARRLVRQRGTVRAVRRHRVPGVAGEADAAGERDLAAGEPVRVSVAVPALVLGADRRCEVGERADRRHDPLADRGMRAHDPPLRVGQLARLLQDRLGHAELADVVQERDLRDLRRPRRRTGRARARPRSRARPPPRSARPCSARAPSAPRAAPGRRWPRPRAGRRGGGWRSRSIWSAMIRASTSSRRASRSRSEGVGSAEMQHSEP